MCVWRRERRFRIESICGHTNLALVFNSFWINPKIQLHILAITCGEMAKWRFEWWKISFGSRWAMRARRRVIGKVIILLFNMITYRCGPMAIEFQLRLIANRNIWHFRSISRRYILAVRARDISQNAINSNGFHVCFTAFSVCMWNCTHHRTVILGIHTYTSTYVVGTYPLRR